MNFVQFLLACNQNGWNSQLATGLGGYSTKPQINTLMSNTVVLKYPDSLICFTVFNTRTRNEARVNALRASSLCYKLWRKSKRASQSHLLQVRIAFLTFWQFRNLCLIICSFKNNRIQKEDINYRTEIEINNRIEEEEVNIKIGLGRSIHAR